MTVRFELTADRTALVLLFLFGNRVKGHFVFQYVFQSYHVGLEFIQFYIPTSNPMW